MNNKELFAMLDSVRHRTSLSAICQMVKKKDLEITIENVEHIMRMPGRAFGAEIPIPGHVVEFVLGVLADRKVASIYDPWAGAGLLVSRVAQQFPYSRTVACGRDRDTVELGRSTSSDIDISWLYAEPNPEVTISERDFSITVSFPPLNSRRHRRSYPTSDGELEIHDSLGSHVILDSCLRMVAGGIGIFIVPNSFLTQNRGSSVYENMAAFGVGVRAVVAVPAGAFHPYTNIETNIVVIEQGVKDELFVGRLSDDRKHNEILNGNLLESKAGRDLALGQAPRTCGLR